jgi:hypothetical protein
MFQEVWGAHAPSRADCGASPQLSDAEAIFFKLPALKKFTLAGRPRQVRRGDRSPEN